MRKFFLFLNLSSLLGLCLVLGGCEPQIQYEIPYAYVEIDINLNDIEFDDLRLDGGYAYILGGVRGIIIYRVSEQEYRTFERNSPVNATAACSIIDVDASGLFLVDPCHNVYFDFDGQPISGNSLPLLQYAAILDLNWLYIRNSTL